MKNPKDGGPKQAIVFELENVAAHGHAVLYGVLREALGKKSIELTPGVFARYCLNSTIDKFLGRLLTELGKTQLAGEKMAEDIKKSYLDALTANGSKLLPAMRAVIEKAAGKHAAAGALSCLGSERSQRVAEHLGLPALGVTVRQRTADYGSCVSKEEWLKLLSGMAALPAASVAIVSTAEACKAALSCRMKVVACPGKYANFGDFGGADAVVDTLDNATVELVLSLLEPHSWA
jgi:beta-phosphoglucomutase-like phosphatase (HAD superfamily)